MTEYMFFCIDVLLSDIWIILENWEQISILGCQNILCVLFKYEIEQWQWRLL